MLQSEFPYNISARCINKEWFFLPMDQVWQIFSEELSKTIYEKNLQVHSFVLMTNHFHMIASTPSANISECMQIFLKRSSRRLTRAGNRINQTFGRRYFKCILHKQNYFLNTYKYNYRNPVAAGLCNLVEDYKYSTLHSLCGKSDQVIPILKDTTYLSNPDSVIKWLNTAPDPQKLEAVRYALKRLYFKSKRQTSNNQFILGDNDTL